jgi:hypothetical protein
VVVAAGSAVVAAGADTTINNSGTLVGPMLDTEHYCGTFATTLAVEAEDEIA